MMTIRKRILWIAVLTFLGLPAFAADVYYVATDGSDTNLGTFGSPWRTIGKAADTLEAGDTVYVRGGTYIERVKPKNSGSALGGYITYSNYENEEVILNDTGLASGYEDEVMFWIWHKSYIKVIGFHADGHKGNGIRVSGPGSHIEIRNCIVSNQIYSSNVPAGQSHAMILFAWLEYSGPLDNIIVDNCEIYNNSTGEPGGYNEAFTIFGAVSNFQITNNYIHDNHYIGNDYIGQPEYLGTEFGVPTNGLIKGNVAENNGTNAIYCSGFYSDGAGTGTPDEIFLEENISFGNRYTGIELGDEHNSAISGGWTVRRNICYDNDEFGLLLGSFGTPITNTKIHNNVFYKNKKTELYIGATNVSNASIRNNIIYRSGDFPFIYWTGSANSTITSDYNCWWPAGGEFQWAGSFYYGLSSFQSGSGQGQHSIQQNPLFVDETNADNYDFHLQEYSPCIDKGVDVGLAYAGTAPDIGAYEYEFGSIFEDDFESGNLTAWSRTMPLQ